MASFFNIFSGKNKQPEQPKPPEPEVMKYRVRYMNGKYYALSNATSTSMQALAEWLGTDLWDRYGVVSKTRNDPAFTPLKIKILDMKTGDSMTYDVDQEFYKLTPETSATRKSE